MLEDADRYLQINFCEFIVKSNQGFQGFPPRVNGGRSVDVTVNQGGSVSITVQKLCCMIGNPDPTPAPVVLPQQVDMWNSNAYRLELQFSIRETVCTKASGRDPFTCDFKLGPFVPTAFCRSSVEVSGELISNVIVQCHRGTSSSESMSSEEMMRVPIMNPNRRGSSRREVASGSRGDILSNTSLGSVPAFAAKQRRLALQPRIASKSCTGENQLWMMVVCFPKGNKLTWNGLSKD
ncbi:secreted phosphoprotein 24 [Grus japonensis]|uniref:Secreted phosphoprotein 24 n=1 Tax=Grus japonensis TaxID=30415 RepID=A0ABC9X2D4_GRUJA